MGSLSKLVGANGNEAVLIAQGQVFYCRYGDEGICLIENVDIALPVWGC